ncbi:hypothetical protein B5M09_006303 [Aphanomyces astaci]|uniref:Uncharacterized protein n=1 Tax=Aphanomyces astaci TaxID=112090 RepID=A0A3R7Y980_APHAT|nr:hypothetical protein B5M09_006303 [Aphanomyces astaci]
MNDIVRSAHGTIGGAMDAASSLLTMVRTRATDSQVSLQVAWESFKLIAAYRVEVVLAVFVLGLILAKLLDSCYAGESPLDALDLSSSLAFSCSLPTDLAVATTGPSMLSSIEPLVNQMNG